MLIHNARWQVKVPKGCDYTKKDKCLLDDINSNEIVVKFKSGDNNGIIEFNLDTLDNTDGGSKTQWTAVQFPGDKSQWPPKAGVDLCNDATGTGKKFRGIIDKSQWKCGLKFLVCVKPEKNPWSYANTGCCFTVKVSRPTTACTPI
ncbi:hypothetical protein WJX72_004793 [[Myrmecia] bisecta]|uniref:Uncharacterized protein n=1 Tax=[Myrmecia] bisecta TaxID=41462 RepID=A0AAW1QEZ7_9CHLO